MDRFSRKLVLLLLLVIWQSSLGTNAIQLESQNLWNEKAQNGYVKYSNGLLIQWEKRLQEEVIKELFISQFHSTTPIIHYV